MRIIPLLATMVLFFCTQPIEDDNLYDPACNDGDYEFSMAIDGVADTLFAGVRYRLDVTDQGDDRYVLFRISTRHETLTSHSTTELTSEPGVIAFRSAGSCTLLVRAVRKNGNEDTAQHIYTVKNPYCIVVDSASFLAGDTVLFKIKSSIAMDTADTLCRAEWSSLSHTGNSGRPDLSLFMPHTVALDSLPDTIWVSAVVRDTFGLNVSLDTLIVPVAGRVIPQVWFTENSINVTINSITAIPAEMSNADSLVWTSLYRGETVVTTAPEVEMVWTDSAVDTLLVTAMNRFGTFGTSDTVIINPMINKYGLKIILFPTSVDAGDYGVWQVVATENNRETTDPDVNYHWEFGKEYTSIREVDENGMMSVKYAKPVSKFMISVTAYKGTDSSAVYSRMVTITDNRPHITAVAQKDTISVDERVTITVNARDVNINGSIKAVYYQEGSEDSEAVKLESDTVGFVFSEAGLQYVRFWCVDNSDFVSDTILKALYVTSTHPYFINRIDSVYGYVGDTITLRAPAHTDRPGDSIVAWNWYSPTSDTPFKSTSADFFDTLFSDAGAMTFKVKCTSASGESTLVDASLNVRISHGLPNVSSATVSVPAKVYVNDTVALHVAVRDSSPDGTVTLILVKMADDTVATFEVSPPSQLVDSTFKVVLPPRHGVYAVSVVAVDNDNNASPVYLVEDSVVVLQGRPSVRKITPDSCWINDVRQYTVAAVDVNPRGLLSYFARFDTTGSFTAYNNDSTFTHAFSPAGTHIIECYVVDRDGMASDTVFETVMVSDGAPHITAIATDTAGVRFFVNDPITFSLTVADPNDDSLDVWISWNDDTIGELSQHVASNNVAVSHLFGKSDTGAQTIRFRVTDRDGMKHDTTYSVVVSLGTPLVTAVTADTCAACMFVADSILFKITASDENGVLKKIYVNWNGGTGAQDSVAISVNTKQVTSAIRHKYSTAQSGTQTVSAWVVDEDGVVSSKMTKVINVRLGLPVMRAAWCDSSKVWVNDACRYTVSAHDTNGTVRKVYVNWNGGSSADDSLLVAPGKASVDTFFTYAYDTGSSGSHTPKFWASDDDGIAAASRDTTLFVHLGAPTIGGDHGDTLWVKVVDKGPGNYYYKPKYADSNGTIQKFYFGLSNNLASATESTVDSSTIPIDENDINIVAGIRYIWVKDDDGLVRGGRFLIYADSAPPQPEPIEPVNASSDTGNVTFKWKGFDVHDKAETLFRVMYYKGTMSPAPVNDMNFIKGTGLAFNSADTSFSYTGKSLPAGTLNWFVIAKDINGMESVSDTLYFDH